MPTGTEAGRVWVDLNADGVQDGGEPGVPGVLVEALDNMWMPAASDTTDADGHYEVTGVPDDSYNAQLTLPAGSPYSFGSAGSGITTMLYPMGVGSTVDIPVYAPPPLPVVSVSRVNDAVEGGTNGTFRFARTGPTTDTLTASYTVLTTGPGYANPGGDYAALSGSVAFWPGMATVDVDVDAYQDYVAEYPETVDVLVVEGTGYEPSEFGAQVGIWDDDSLLLPQVTVSGVADAVEGGAVGVLRFARTGSIDTALVAGYSISSGAGAATPDADYPALSGSVTFPVGKAVVDVLVTASADATTEGTETVTAVVQAGTGYDVGTPSTGVVKIADPDANPGSEWGVIGGIVWEDESADGIRDAEELLLENYPVTLHDAGGAELFTILTAVDGSYAFGGLEAGTYTVSFGRPNFEVFTLQDQGADESTDSDADRATGLTAPIPLVTGAMTYLSAGLGVLVQPPGPRVVFTNAADEETTKLRVAKWQNAFEDDPPTVRPKWLDEATGLDFIDKDPDRFNVWVFDPVRWQAGAERVDVSVSTTAVAGFEASNDPASTIDLVRFVGPQRGQGWFWSESQLLVSNELDDRHSVFPFLVDDEAIPGRLGREKLGYRWRLTDRTHRVALRSTVNAEYRDTNFALVSGGATVPVNAVVKVHATILKSGTAAMPGEAVITPEAANLAIHNANEQLAQVGVLLIPNSPIPVVNPPAEVDFTNGLDTSSSDSNTGAIIMPDETRKLLDAPYRTAALDDVELYFINRFAAPARGGEAFPAVGLLPERYVDTAIVIVKDGKVGNSPFTIAHEIGHLLTNAGHYQGPLEAANLMRSSPSEVDSVIASKRLTNGQEVDMVGCAEADPPIAPRRPNLVGAL